MCSRIVAVSRKPPMPQTAPPIRAVLVTPGVPGSLSLGMAPAPVALPPESLVKVAAISLNLGETRRAQTEAAGLRTGWDLAGTVIAAAANGIGPKAGARVVGIVERGAWSETVAVPASQLSTIPDAVSFAQAATLPVAGLTALYALEQRGGVLGRRVLVTGASGGVGHFACQLARQAGAHVIGQIRRAGQEDFARKAGAHDIIVGDSEMIDVNRHGGGIGEQLAITRLVLERIIATAIEIGGVGEGTKLTPLHVFQHILNDFGFVHFGVPLRLIRIYTNSRENQ